MPLAKQTCQHNTIDVSPYLETPFLRNCHGTITSIHEYGETAPAKKTASEMADNRRQTEIMIALTLAKQEQREKINGYYEKQVNTNGWPYN